MEQVRAAFVVVNDFQAIQFSNIARHGRDVTFASLQGKTALGGDIKASLPGKVASYKTADVSQFDRRFDVIFFQTPFPRIEEIASAKLVSVQYGLAKERHNYGEWRALADLNLMYGEYSRAKVEHFSPSVAIGNPKFDGWGLDVKPTSDEKNLFGALNAGMKTLLYMPTWGALGSFDELAPVLARLQGEFNVVLKMHHNDAFAAPEWRKRAERAGLRHIYDGSCDQLALLRAADLVISDYSGAIFDAMYAKVPVLLFQTSAAERVGVQKFDLASIEFARRHEIGMVCTDIRDFRGAVGEALADGESLVKVASPLRKSLFCDTSMELAGKAAWLQVRRMMDGELALSKQQLYVRDCVRQCRALAREVAGLKGTPPKFKFGAVVRAASAARKWIAGL